MGSASRNRMTPLRQMSVGDDMIWELHPREPSDVAFHFGADVSLLSQFAAEEEVLFPPYTMLVAQQLRDPLARPRVTHPALKGVVGNVDVEEGCELGKRFVA